MCVEHVASRGTWGVPINFEKSPATKNLKRYNLEGKRI
jgi:hypothetical protein